MSSPFQNSQNTTRYDYDFSSDPSQPHITYARVAASSSRARNGSSSRTGPTSFSNILNPSDGDWNAAYYNTGSAARGQEEQHQQTGIMTQNGASSDGAAGTNNNGFYPAPSQQLPESSRAFEHFMTRATLDTLPDIFGGRPETSSVSSSIHHFPRPSYLEGSQYLARLEQQARSRALSQRESNGALAPNGAGLSSTGGGKPPIAPPYHLGIARDVVERTTPGGAAHEPQAEEDAIDPLPTRWGSSKEEKATGLEVLSDGLEVKYTGPRNPNERDHEACAVRADHPMPLQCGLYYFEVTILSRKNADTTIGIGFSGKNVALTRAPGWENESWGYHGDDGHVFASQNVGKHYGPTFSSGDTIGCGVNFRTNTAFFTKNGRSLGQAFKEVKGKLYPMVGLKKTGEHIRVNFGSKPFLFDIDALMKIHGAFDDPIWELRPVSRRLSFPAWLERTAIPIPYQRQRSISLASTNEYGSGVKIEPEVWSRPASQIPPTETSDFAQSWTLDDFYSSFSETYWLERGWKEIHRLEEEISKADTSKLAPPLNETDLIQQLVLQFLQHDGYVETARSFAQEIQSEKQSLCLDPKVMVPGIDIRDDEDANNRQRIRRAILEGDIDRALKHTSESYPHVLRENEQVYFRLKCRKFIEMIRREAETNLVGGDKGSHSNGHFHPPQTEDMELDDDMEDADTDYHAGDLTQDALMFGQKLQAEYYGDTRSEVRQALDEIFSLIAYQNPLKEPKVAHLLDRKGRVAVAEELNSAILQSLGKSSRAALENVYAQTSVLLDMLAESGGPGAFVTMKSIMDEVEPSSSDF